MDYEISQNPGDGVSFKKIINGVIGIIGKKPKTATAGGAYGSEENLDFSKQAEIKSFVKFQTYFKEKSKKWKEQTFRIKDFIFDKKKNILICPNNKILILIQKTKQYTKTGYEKNISIYQAEEADCASCPLKEKCTKSTKRQVQVDWYGEQLKDETRKNLDSSEGRWYRRRRAVEAETPFGDQKQNQIHRRYFLRGLEKVEIESGLFYTAYNIRKLYLYALQKMYSPDWKYIQLADKSK